jgi:PAS domain S-box
LEEHPVSEHPADLRSPPGALPGPTLAVLEASPNPIVAVDSAARISYVNPQVEACFGYTRDELLGQHRATVSIDAT